MRKLFSSRKGSSLVLMMLVDVLVAIMVILVFVGIHQMLTDESKMENLVMARDVATLIDAGHTTERDILYTYPESFYEKDFFYNKSLLSVTEGDIGMSDVTASLRFLTQYTVHESDYITIKEQGKIDGTLLIFKKEDDTITIKDNIEEASGEGSDIKSQDAESRADVSFKIITPESSGSTIGGLTRDVCTGLKIEDSFEIISEDESFDKEADMTIMLDAVHEDTITVYYSEMERRSSERLAECLKENLKGLENIDVTQEVLSYNPLKYEPSVKVTIPKDIKKTGHFKDLMIYGMKECYPEK